MPSASESSGVTDRINVAFWNLQNLFDVEASRLASDLEFTSVNGWDRRAFERKVTNLAKVVRLMFDGQGPDLLGVCEIENQRVADILVRAIGRDDYAVAHVEHPDIHGLDTSLIYSTRLFDFDAENSRGHMVSLQYPTRDIFEVHLKVKSNAAKLVVLVNHWPSRRPGRVETEPFRLTAASHCHRLVNKTLKLSRKDYLMLQDDDRSLEVLNAAWDRNVLVMGDFNDEPWARSVMEIMQSGYTVRPLEERISFVRGSLPSYRRYTSRPARLFNPMWSLLQKPDQGTHYDASAVQSMALPDQFLLSRGLYFGCNGLLCEQSETGVPRVDIFRPDILSDAVGRPQEFRNESQTGYSDHLPITTTLLVTG